MHFTKTTNVLKWNGKSLHIIIDPMKQANHITMKTSLKSADWAPGADKMLISVYS